MFREKNEWHVYYKVDRPRMYGYGTRNDAEAYCRVLNALELHAWMRKPSGRYQPYNVFSVHGTKTPRDMHINNSFVIRDRLLSST